MEIRKLTNIWLILIGITLGSAVLAERQLWALWMVLAVCAGVIVKGQLVIDRLMGLQGTSRPIRWVMLSYFYLLPPLIALGWLFPDLLRRLTTL